MKNFIYFLIYLLALCSYTDSSSLIWPGKSVGTVSKYISFQVYYGKYAGNFTYLKYGERHLLNETKGFDPNNLSIFYFPGWGDYPRMDNLRKSLKTVIPALRTLPNTNLVILDYWDLVQKKNYVEAVVNATYIGEALAQFFIELIPNIQPREKVRLIGFSLGCQIISNTARNLIDMGQKFMRITGLDPAGPGFKFTSNHLKSSDADFVDLIHTNDNAMGLPGLGTINYYPNGGMIQLPCISNITSSVYCSHAMAWRIFAESIYNPLGFVAKKCSSYCQYTYPVCSCEDEDLSYVGIDQDISKSGSYFFTTNYEPPYALGEKGLIFNHPTSVIKEVVKSLFF